MSTSFPNNNGNVPPYNSQANGSFNQFGQGAPPGAFPGIDQFHHNMYSQNGYVGMPTSNMGGPPQSGGLPSQQQKPLPPQQYPGAGAGGVKLPGYDGNPMQNGFMHYPPHPQRPGQTPQNGQNPMIGQANGPPPSYNGHPHMSPANNPYNGVPDPYRMYPGMPGSLAPGQGPQAQQRQMPPASNAAPPSQQRPPPQSTSQQYPSQQPLPAHLHPGAPQYLQMATPNAPLQHYQPANFGNSTPPVRGASNVPPKAVKEAEARPNNLPPSFPNSGYPGNFGGPGSSGAGTPSGPYGSYNGGPGGFPGYGMPGGSGRPESAGPPNNNGGMNGSTMNGQATPGSSGPHGFGTSNGFNSPFSGGNGPNGPGSAGPFAPTGSMPPHGSTPTSTNGNSAFGNPGSASNDSAGGRGTPGNYGTPGHLTPGSQPRQTTSSAPGTPGTPGAHGLHGNVPPVQSPLAQQSSLRTPPTLHQQQPMQNQGPPHYNHNNMMSPNHAAGGNGPQASMKQPARSPMGSTLPPLNGNYPMGQNMQSPVNPSSAEPTFKEPAVPIRHSPAHMQSPAQLPSQPPAYNTQPSPSAPKPSEPSPNTQRPASPTFAVPTLPAAATLAQASSANQVSTKPKTSPTKKKGDEEPPTLDTPFTTVTHYELPAALVILREALTLKANPQLDKYFTRKRQPLRVPYPEGVNVQNVPATEPDTFGFLQGTKYFDQKYNRGIPTPSSMGPPMLSRSQSMHAPMMSPSFNAQQASSSGRQPAKKARSASDASEPAFNVPLPPSRQQMRPMDPRAMHPMQMHYQQQQMHQHQQMQKMQQQQQMMARQQQIGGPGPGLGGMPTAPGASQLPPLVPPSLQRADSMPQLPSQLQGPMGPMSGHMGGMPPMNGNGAEGLTPNNNTGHSLGIHGHPPQGQGPTGMQNHEFGTGQQPSTSSSQAQVTCAGCHQFILPGSSTLCCMYHDCKNVYHRECTRLSPSAYMRFEQETPHVRWVCPICEPQVRQLQMQHS